MRKKIVAGNWKMNLDYSEGISLFSEIVNMVRDEKKGDQAVVICAPFIHLNSLSQLAAGAGVVKIGAQKLSSERKRCVYWRNFSKDD
jgi:triosephosphate isomerase